MTAHPPLRFALIGCGFWGRHQLAAWKEVGEVECVAVCDRDGSKAEAVAAEFGIAQVHDDAHCLFEEERLDFVDIVTDVTTHAPLALLAAERGVSVICQKPLATTLNEAEAMADACRRAGVLLLVHENWRWQRPIRHLKTILESGEIGGPFRARIDMLSGFPVFENQPALKELEQFILTDLGTHILDVARFLFGEADRLYCQTHRTLADIRGENVATVVLSCGGGRTTVTCNMAFAGNALERECFPQTLFFVEGTRGSVEIAPDYDLRVTTAAGIRRVHLPPETYSWVNPAYAVVQSSIVNCHRNLARGLRDPDHPAETTAGDNLKTLRLVFKAYESAASGQAIAFC